MKHAVMIFFIFFPSVLTGLIGMVIAKIGGDKSNKKLMFIGVSIIFMSAISYCLIDLTIKSLIKWGIK